MGQQFRSVGGAEASPQILDACFGRMVLWVELCKETLQAEWPTFEALQCFILVEIERVLKLIPLLINEQSRNKLSLRRLRE